jgi:hypothetical protein
MSCPLQLVSLHKVQGCDEALQNSLGIIDETKCTNFVLCSQQAVKAKLRQSQFQEKFKTNLIN